MFHYLFASIASIMYLALAVILSHLGFNYMDPEISYGLNPMLAFPLATVCVLIGIALPVYIGRCYRDGSIHENPFEDTSEDLQWPEVPRV